MTTQAESDFGTGQRVCWVEDGRKGPPASRPVGEGAGGAEGLGTVGRQVSSAWGWGGGRSGLILSSFITVTLGSRTDPVFSDAPVPDFSVAYLLALQGPSQPVS